VITLFWLKQVTAGLGRSWRSRNRNRNRNRNPLRQPRSRSRGMCRPRIELLEDRRAPASGIFVEDFSDDLNPNQPGFDSNADGFRIQLGFVNGAIGNIVTGGRFFGGTTGERHSSPFVLQTGGPTIVTFPDLAPGDVIHVASVKVAGLSVSARFFSTTGERLTVFGVYDTFGIRQMVASSASRSDSGNPLGPIERIEFGFGDYDDIRVRVGGEPPVAGGVIFTENFSDDLDPTQGGYDTPLDSFHIQPTVRAQDSETAGTGLWHINSFIEEFDVPAPEGNVASQPYFLFLGWEPPNRFGSPGEDSEGATQRYVAAVPDFRQPGGLVAGEEIALAKVSVYGDGRVTFVGATGRTSTVDVLGSQGWQFVSRASSFEDAQGLKLGGIIEIRVETSSFMLIDDVTMLIGTEQGTGPVQAFDDGVTGPPELPLTVRVLDNDVPAGGAGAGLSITAVTQPEQGVAAISGDTIIYTSEPRFRGTDFFEYTVSDTSGNSDTGRVIVDVPNQPPVAVDVLVELDHGAPGPLVSTFQFGDRNGDAVNAFLIRPPDFGEMTFRRSAADPSGSILVEYVYQPFGGVFIGSDHFTYKLNDGIDDSNVATVTINVPNQPPTIEGFTIFRTHAEALAHADGLPITGNLLLGANDPDGDRLTAQLVEGPAHGSVAIEPDGSFIWHTLFGAAPGFVTDSFTFRVHDGHARTLPATLTVVAPNTAPRAVGEFYFFSDGPDSLTIADPGVLENDRDPGADLADISLDVDGDRLTATIVFPPTKGTLQFSEGSGGFTYTPFEGAGGFDVFAYRVADRWTVSNVATVTLSLFTREGTALLEPAQIAHGDGPYEVSPGLLSRIPAPAITADDLDPGIIAYLIEVPRPNPDDPNLPPVGWDVVLADQLSGRQSLQNGRPNMRLEIVFPPAHGFITPHEASFTYRPDDGYTGPDSFLYRVHYDHLLNDLIPDDKDPLGDPTLPLVSDVAFFSLHVGEIDAAIDGAFDDEEDGAPNGGDGNGDGIPDRLQPNVVSMRNAVDDEYVTLEAPPGARLFQALSAGTPAFLPELRELLPIGTFDFTVTGLAIGEAITVTIHLASPRVLDSYFKYPQDFGNYFDDLIEFLYDGQTGAQFFGQGGQQVPPGTPVSKIVLHLVDGQRGDDDGVANGVIVDPGGPVVLRPPTVTSVVIHNQRSKVKRLTVSFDKLVSLAPGAFTLLRRGDVKPTRLNVAVSEAGGRTVARLTFKGRGTVNGGLAKGHYKLTVHGAKVRGALLALDGDKDGVPGGDAITAFFRRAGKLDGKMGWLKPG